MEGNNVRLLFVIEAITIVVLVLVILAFLFRFILVGAFGNPGGPGSPGGPGGPGSPGGISPGGRINSQFYQTSMPIHQAAHHLALTSFAVRQAEFFNATSERKV